ncbi:MAG: hypothetical protein Q7T70_00495, partial [Polaromonas sp.]|nr:hypothetical protein [Polaromonas sp.]
DAKDKSEVGVPDRFELWAAKATLSGVDLPLHHRIFYARIGGLEPPPSSRLVQITRSAMLPALDSDEQAGGLLNDVDLREDIEVMEALQDLALKECAEMSIAIEANPTSNVYIGPLRSYAEHPIFRWAPPAWIPETEWNPFGIRKADLPVRVLVNTDDPGIMPTTLRMELDLLRNAAMLRPGVTAEDASGWVEAFRAAGIAEFSEKHVPVFEM